ncbi:MAG TPA: redoxin domain-containing protein [Solirubrobacteraceae bacterium]|nr:redoxin domain-containing protein [Solirubrobacteraceae bacterium]
MDAARFGVLPAGTPAPAFKLTKGDFGAFTEADLRGRVTVLVFYPFAFSPVCTDQLQLYEEITRELAARGDALYGVSCDAAWSQTAFKEKLGVSCEQLSDFEPKGAACEAFGVLHPGGFAQRALVITDADGVVAWSHEAGSPGDLPPLELLREGLGEASGAPA